MIARELVRACPPSVFVSVSLAVVVPVSVALVVAAAVSVAMSASLSMSVAYVPSAVYLCPVNATCYVSAPAPVMDILRQTVNCKPCRDFLV